MKDNFDKIIQLLKAGKVILYPTDTIWGLGCDATNVDAINKIYEIKKRDTDNPLLIIVSDIDMLKEYVKSIHPRVETLLVHHKRPLTIIYPAGDMLPDILLKKGKIAIRIIQEPVIAQLVKRFGKPIVSTSANIAGVEFPKTFKDISSSIINSVDYVFKYRQNDKTLGEPSVIATYNKRGKLKFFR